MRIHLLHHPAVKIEFLAGETQEVRISPLGIICRLDPVGGTRDRRIAALVRIAIERAIGAGADDAAKRDAERTTLHAMLLIRRGMVISSLQDTVDVKIGHPGRRCHVDFRPCVRREDRFGMSLRRRDFPTTVAT